MIEKGIGKVQFLALWPQIEEKLTAGYPVAFVYRHFEAQLAIKRRRFNDLVREYYRSKTFSSLPLHTQKHSPSPQPPRRRLTEPRADSSPSKPQTFQHDPRPLKDYFAKGAGS